MEESAQHCPYCSAPRAAADQFCSCGFVRLDTWKPGPPTVGITIPVAGLVSELLPGIRRFEQVGERPGFTIHTAERLGETLTILVLDRDHGACALPPPEHAWPMTTEGPLGPELWMRAFKPEGRQLSRVRPDELDEAQLLAIACGICRGVMELHEAGLGRTELSADDVWLARTAHGERVQLSLTSTPGAPARDLSELFLSLGGRNPGGHLDTVARTLRSTRQWDVPHILAQLQAKPEEEEEEEATVVTLVGVPRSGRWKGAWLPLGVGGLIGFGLAVGWVFSGRLAALVAVPQPEPAATVAQAPVEVTPGLFAEPAHAATTPPRTAAKTPSLHVPSATGTEARVPPSALNGSWWGLWSEKRLELYLTFRGDGTVSGDLAHRRGYGQLAGTWTGDPGGEVRIKVQLEGRRPLVFEGVLTSGAGEGAVSLMGEDEGEWWAELQEKKAP
jgi:hypothetical protein